MQTFKDEKDRVWSISVGYDTIEMLRKDLQVDLLKMIESEDEANRVSQDSMLVFSVVYALIEDQIAKKNLTKAEFSEAMAGMALDRAWEAIEDGIINFFRSPKREVLRQALDKKRDAEKRLIAQALKKIDSDQMDQIINRQLQKFDDLFTNAVESSELAAPDIGPSAN